MEPADRDAGCSRVADGGRDRYRTATSPPRPWRRCRRRRSPPIVRCPRKQVNSTGSASYSRAFCASPISPMISTATGACTRVLISIGRRAVLDTE